MGTVIERKTADGSSSRRVEIILKRDKKIVHRVSRTFAKAEVARDWVDTRERLLRKPGVLETLIAREIVKVTVNDLVARHIAKNRVVMGKTGLTCLKAIATCYIANILCEGLRPSHTCTFAQTLYASKRKPQKHLGQKAGKDVRCAIPDTALRVTHLMPKHTRNGLIFGVSPDGMSKTFTEACKFLEIRDFHVHNLRHEDISWQVEQGLTIPQVATVSSHRSWPSLQRYPQICRTGEKYADWKWWPARDHGSGYPLPGSPSPPTQ